MDSRLDVSDERMNLVALGRKFQLKIGQNTYTSTRELTDGQLMACQVIDNKLVCRPVSEIHDLRSDFTHLDVVEVSEVEPEARMVNIRFASTDNAKIVEPEEEPIESRELVFRSLKSKEARSQRTLLFAAPVIKQEPDIKPDLDQVTKRAQNTSKKGTQTKELVLECLMKAKLLSFKAIKDYIEIHSECANDKDVIDALTEYAVMVQGNWAVKSEVLYGDSGAREGTDVTGISINLFTAARDYLLWLFNRERILSRPKYCRQVRIPDHDVLELFNQIATFRPELKKWEFKLPEDTAFKDNFPDVVQRQDTFWVVKRANKLGIFEDDLTNE